MTIASTLDFLGSHPIKKLARWIGDLLGPGCDTVSLIMFLCRAGARNGTPFNLWLNSVDTSTDQILFDRLLNVDRFGVATIATPWECRALAKSNFPECELLVAQNDRVFDSLLSYVGADLAFRPVPAIVRVSDESPDRTAGATLHLQIADEARSLSGLDRYFASQTTPHRRSRSRLASVLKRLEALNSRVSCPFAKRIVALISASEKLTFTRLLYTIASIREVMSPSNPTGLGVQVQREDYEVTRQLLNNLPLVGKHSAVSSSSAHYGSILYAEIMETDFQGTIPDQSDFGHKAFTRRNAEALLGIAYNSALRVLDDLEGHGAIESLVVSSSTKHQRVRGRGRQIYYRFRPNRHPPFGVRNPYSVLPTINEIESDCNHALQS